MAWATAQDVVDAWIGPDVPEDLVKVQLWVEKGEREIRRRVPDLQARIDGEADESPPSTDLLEAAKDVVVAMVTRKFQNPTGTRQRNATTTTGPFSETVSETMAGGIPGEFVPSDAELAKLSGLSDGAFSISLIPSSSPFFAGP